MVLGPAVEGIRANQLHFICMPHGSHHANDGLPVVASKPSSSTEGYFLVQHCAPLLERDGPASLDAVKEVIMWAHRGMYM